MSDTIDLAPYPVGATVLRPRDPRQRKFRFHALMIHPDLLAGWSLQRDWGRIGSPGRVAITAFPDRDHALVEAERYAARKRRKGYQG